MPGNHDESEKHRVNNIIKKRMHGKWQLLYLIVKNHRSYVRVVLDQLYIVYF